MNRYTSISIAKNENSNVANIGARYYVTNFYPSIPLVKKRYPNAN